MKSGLRRLLFENLVLKVISLALAVVLFSLVRAEKRSVAYGSVAVSFNAPVGKTLVGDPPRQLQVSVLGPASRIPRFRFEDLAAVNVDLSRVAAGYLKFRPEMIRLPRGFTVSGIRPAGFTVRYEALVQRSVPVHVTLDGQVASGLRVVRAVAQPASVMVRGPERAIRALAELRTEPVMLEGAKADLVARVRLQPLSPALAGELPREVTVRVKVGPVIPTVTLKAIPVVVEDPTQRELTVEPAQVDVGVEGPPQVLANLKKSVLAARVTLTGSERGNLDVVPRIVGLPGNVVVRKLSPGQVTVRLKQPVARPGARIPGARKKPREGPSGPRSRQVQGK